MPTRGCLGTLGGVLLALLLLTLGIARLRRFPRVQFVAHHSLARGDVQLGDTVTMRGGVVSQRLGASVLCRGREVLSRVHATVVLREAQPQVRIELQPQGERYRIELPACRVVRE